MKFCPSCRENKLNSEFYKNLRNRDGLRTYCKKCNNKKGLEWKHSGTTKANAKILRDREIAKKIYYGGKGVRMIKKVYYYTDGTIKEILKSLE